MLLCAKFRLSLSFNLKFSSIFKPCVNSRVLLAARRMTMIQSNFCSNRNTSASFVAPSEMSLPLGEGLLLLRFEQPRAIAMAIAALKKARFEMQRSGEVLTVRVAQSEIARLVRVLAESLSVVEQSAVRVIWEVVGRALSLRDCFDVQTLREWLARAQSGWFLAMMRDDKFESHFQPIVRVRAPYEIYGYESLLRGVADSGLVAPLSLFEVAGGLNLRAQLCAKARQRAICRAGSLGLKERVFINCLPSALDDAPAALRATLGLIDDAGLAREQIVLEIIESECIEDARTLRAGLELFRQAGIGIALDDLGAGYSSLTLLDKLRPDFVKLDRDLIGGVDGDGFKAVIAQKLLETARNLGIITVAEGVETVGEWNWLRAHGGELAQGYLFARPAATPPVSSAWNRAISLN